MSLCLPPCVCICMAMPGQQDGEELPEQVHPEASSGEVQPHAAAGAEGEVNEHKQPPEQPSSRQDEQDDATGNKDGDNMMDDEGDEGDDASEKAKQAAAARKRSL